MATAKGAPPRLVPFVIVSLMTLLFLIWAMRQCSADTGDDAAVEEQRSRTEYLLRQRIDSLRQDSIRLAQLTQAIPTQAGSLEEQEAAARQAALLRARSTPLPGDSAVYFPGQSAQRVVVEKKTVLYSTIDGLNVRNRPGLEEGRIIARLPLFQEVTFMGEVTDSLHEIDLGEITPREPWVKVQLADGQVGWVYGAGVRYYKYRLQGVIN